MLKLKDLKGVIDNNVMIGIPEMGANLYYNDKVSEKYNEREVERIFVDRADDDLIVDLKNLKLKEYKMLNDNMDKVLYDVNSNQSHVINEDILERYGDCEIEEVFVSKTSKPVLRIIIDKLSGE